MYRAQKIKEKLNEGKIVYGGNVVFAESAVCELYARAGHDFVWIDMEHGAIDNKDVLAHITATHAGDGCAIVRVPSNDPDIVKKVLDMGADGIIFPLIRSAEETELAVKSCMYPPDGIRGYNPLGAIGYGAMDTEEYCKTSKNSILKIIMLEHIDAYNDLDKILQVPHLDGIILGPSDLSGSMGKMLKTNDPEVQKVLKDIVERCAKTNVFCGIALNCNVGADAYVPWLKAGVKFFSLGQDVDFLGAMARKKVNDIKEAERLFKGE